MGNLLNDGTTSYGYDALNRLTVRTAGGVTTSSASNGDGVLVAQTVGGTTTRYTQDLAAPLSQILSDGMATYVYGAERLAGVTGGVRTWYHGDLLGSVRQTTNDAGAVQGLAHYDAWGTRQSGSVGSFGFAGELQQGSDVYLRARWYNTANGTFTARDPWAGDSTRPDTLNSYAYVGNRPTMLTDASGQCYPPFEALRTVEPGNCANLDAAYHIYEHPRANASGRSQALAYITAFWASHGVGAVGIGLLGVAGIMAAAPAAIDGSTVAVQYLGSHIVAGTGIGKSLIGVGIAFNTYGIGATLRAAYDGDLNALAFLGCPSAFGIATFWEDVVAFGSIRTLRPSLRSSQSSSPVVVDLFGGSTSRIPGAINVDIIAQDGLRASSTALPFGNATVDEIIVNGPQAPFLEEAARIIKIGGRIYINSTKTNKYGKLPSDADLSRLGLRVIQQNQPLDARFQDYRFMRSDGDPVRGDVLTTILERILQ